MTKSKFFHVKNEMLAANFLANFIGVFFVNRVMSVTEIPVPESAAPIIHRVDMIFNPFAFLFVGIMTLYYERPIRQYLNAWFNQTPIPIDLESKARQKVLNEPYVLMLLDISMWFLAAIIFSITYWILDAGSYFIQRSLITALTNGLVTVTLAFFLLEHVLQKRLAPYFFPNGGLSMIPRTLRIRIRTRLIALLFACNLIPLASIINLNCRLVANQSNLATTLQDLQIATMTNAFLFMGLGTCVTMLVSWNLTHPFKEIIQTLRMVRNGRFDKKIQVTSNDEIGYTGDVINEMTEGLIERDRMQQSLNLAKEVQQNLLPKTDLKVNGFDIAGKSVYCDETGGDYYDFMVIGAPAEQKIGIAVGDVSGHGISSALLMASARAFLRQRSALPGSVSQVMSDVNRQLCRDVVESGSFMTLFYMAIDMSGRSIRWVRAGHDPAMIYDMETDSFNELGGRGLALGVHKNFEYEEYERQITPGQIVLVGTDGIWELNNEANEMFGKDRVRDIIRADRSTTAKEILASITDSLNRFRGSRQPADDITMVVIKVQE